MSEGDRIEPRWDIHGVPRCTEGCPSHDGKRCTILGARPESLCEPAVDAAITELRRLRVGVETRRNYGEVKAQHGVRIKALEAAPDRRDILRLHPVHDEGTDDEGYLVEHLELDRDQAEALIAVLRKFIDKRET